jgi:hypothetical protein
MNKARGRTTTIAAALAKCAVAIDTVASERWAFTLSNGTEFDASARVDDGWLLLEAPLDVEAEPAPSRVWELLQWNATLGGGVRFALGPDGGGSRARAELPLDEEVDLYRRVLETCAGLRTANHLLERDAGQATLDTHEDDDLAPGRVLELCRETGWPVIEREPGLLAVDLDVPGTFSQATVEPRANQGVAVVVPVLPGTVRYAESPAPVCRQAVGCLLLRVCGVVRMARAAAEMRDGTPHARFEVVFESQPCAAELTHAFAALSVACRLASREAAVLWSDEKIARAYVGQWNQEKEDNHGTGSNQDTRAAGE